MRREPSANGGARWRSTRNTRRPTSAWATRSTRKGATAEALAALARRHRAAAQRRTRRCGGRPGCWLPRPMRPSATATRRWHSRCGRVQLSGEKDARTLDTLAAAYAEKGQFADAALTGAQGAGTGRAREPARAGGRNQSSGSRCTKRIGRSATGRSPAPARKAVPCQARSGAQCCLLDGECGTLSYRGLWIPAREAASASWGLRVNRHAVHGV